MSLSVSSFSARVAPSLTTATVATPVTSTAPASAPRTGAAFFQDGFTPAAQKPVYESLAQKPVYESLAQKPVYESLAQKPVYE